MIREAQKLYTKCVLCPWECKINRFHEKGKCGLGNISRVFYEGVLYGEEIDISPCYGIFFAGCNLKCTFCECGQYQADPGLARRATIKGMVSSIKEHRNNAGSLQFIGGEPSLQVLQLLKIMQRIKKSSMPPVVMNTNMYFSDRARILLEEITDIFLADFHFGNDICAYHLSGAKDYCVTVFRNIQWALERRIRVIVRHLIMPGHLECCMVPVLNFVKQMPGVQFSALFNYYPCFEATKDVRINRRLSQAEKEEACELLEKNNIMQNPEITHENFFANPPEQSEVEIMIDHEGSVIIQYVTGDMLRIASELNPKNKEFAKRKKILLGDK